MGSYLQVKNKIRSELEYFFKILRALSVYYGCGYFLSEQEEKETIEKEIIERVVSYVTRTSMDTFLEYVGTGRNSKKSSDAEQTEMPGDPENGNSWMLHYVNSFIEDVDWKSFYSIMQRHPKLMMAKTQCCQKSLAISALDSKDDELESWHDSYHESTSGSLKEYLLRWEKESVVRYQMIKWLIYQLPNSVKYEAAQNENRTTILSLLVASIAYSRADIDLLISVAPALNFANYIDTDENADDAFKEHKPIARAFMNLLYQEEYESYATDFYQQFDVMSKVIISLIRMGCDLSGLLIYKKSDGYENQKPETAYDLFKIDGEGKKEQLGWALPFVKHLLNPENEEIYQNKSLENLFNTANVDFIFRDQSLANAFKEIQEDCREDLTTLWEEQLLRLHAAQWRKYYLKRCHERYGKEDLFDGLFYRNQEPDDEKSSTDTLSPSERFEIRKKIISSGKLTSEQRLYNLLLFLDEIIVLSEKHRLEQIRGGRGTTESRFLERTTSHYGI